MTEPMTTFSTAQMLVRFAEELAASDAIDETALTELVCMAGKVLIENDGVVVSRNG